jgi:hypothetical protein
MNYSIPFTQIVMSIHNFFIHLEELIKYAINVMIILFFQDFIQNFVLNKAYGERNITL